jgi:hypothetical protein
MVTVVVSASFFWKILKVPLLGGPSKEIGVMGVAYIISFERGFQTEWM